MGGPQSDLRSSHPGPTFIVHLVQFLLRPSTVSAVAWFAWSELLKTVGVLHIVADERAAADRPWMRQHKAGPALLCLRSMRSTHAADGLRTKPNYHCWEFIIQMTSRGMCPWVGFCSLLQKVFFIQKNESQRVFWRDDYISTKFGCILRFVGSRRDVDCFLPAQKNYIFEIREFCLTQKHNFRHAVKDRLGKSDIWQTIHISSSENLV